MKRRMILISVLAFLMLFAAVAPVMATKPAVVPFQVRIIPAGNVEEGKIWYTGDDTILHVRNRVSTVAILLPQTTPMIIIGMGVSVTDMDFNLKTGEGNAVRTYDITFFEPRTPSGTLTGDPNPYGMGTLQAKAILKATSLFNVYAVGDSTGLFVATHGTGDFENAKVMAEFEGQVYVSGGQLRLRAFVTGELTFHG